MDIRTYGTDKRLGFCREYLISHGERLGRRRIALLPIPSSVDGKALRGSPETDRLVEELRVEDVLVGYGIPKDVRSELSERGTLVADVSRDEEYLLENAELTAVGTVGRLLTDEICAPSELSVGIIGYGRIGQRLSRILMFLGAKVTVFTSKTELREELCMLSVGAVNSLSLSSSEALSALRSLDVLINTAPAMLLPKESVRDLTRMRTIELASGNNFPEGTVPERFSSLPAVMYPKSAGAALARSVIRMLA